MFFSFLLFFSIIFVILFYQLFLLFSIAALKKQMSIWHPAESRRVCLHFFLRHATVRDDVAVRSALALGREEAS